MKFPIVSLHCFHNVGLSITAAFEPVINMEHEAIIGDFKWLYWPLKHLIAPQLTFNSDLMQDSMEFARIHRSRINTSNLSQGECLRNVNHALAYVAGSPPPSHSVYSAVPLPRAVPALTWSDKTQTVNNSGEATAEKCPTFGKAKEKK